jgi:signal transduction histidine kinase
VKPFAAQELVARVRAHLLLTRLRTSAADAADHARQEAEAARVEAEQANRAKSDFLAAMSHELRTPLNAIAGYVQLIEMGVHGPVSDAQRQVLQRVQRSQHHLLSLINDVLNFVKLEAGRVEYDMRAVDLGAVVGAAAPIVEPQLEAKRISFERRVELGTLVWADEDKLRQVLLNLLTNAVKFTEPNGSVTLDVTADGEGDAVLLRVTDTGIGIPAEKQEAIFDPFVQVHRHFTRSTEGTGLGLAISRDLARGMGAELRVESVVGKGSTFTLALQSASVGNREPGIGNRTTA